MNKRLRVAVLMGGKSPEHHISLISGREVVKNLDRRKYEVIPLVISKDNAFPFGQLSIVNCQLFFIAMHGPYGEDGTMQGFLDLIGVPYTGSGVLASALGMDKISSRKLFTQDGLNVPKYLMVQRGDSINGILSKLKLPLFVKPRAQGSSVGVSKVKVKKDLKKALGNAFSYGDEVIVEEFLGGTEVTCAILGNKKPRALPLVEIVPKKEFFDLEAKYDPNLTAEIVPARISRALTKKAQNAALCAYKALDCRGFGRIDMIISKGRPYVLEVNTIPGLTPVSLFPKAAGAAGLTYQKLLDQIITLALEN
ncbi:D-alanine--D-alanine ligase [Candidatus Curtissbacteria bacterium]|nr:D-alanine--D-alanine ligase [Candidatus Curtissbacteria bacterium]